ncbi:membrane protein [Lysobacter helvus]|uniref:Membrane protein n=2 Tax=Lysobacteraceae TaxID=32033 RepID=A0ABN6FY21_9GAMM|nr:MULTISPECIES: VWA domain-containing protein [Lysobacter]BCT92717.1 membrane protein [Lysobacter caseinilyticus]BCT95870.1 membrane protein [Lysobacter helvus]
MNDFSLALLHFVRPAWLWALLALPLIAWLWRLRRRRENAWRGVVDPHLLPHLLEPAGGVRARSAIVFVLLAYALAILALAGPAWRQVPQPSWQSRTPLVIAMDLSSASAATDLPPSRLLQARAKVATLLRERNGGQVGLVAFADDAYTVAPLTDDAANVALFLDSLEPSVMPIDGHRPGHAIRQGARLLQQAGFDRGDILVLTDHGDTDANEAAREAAGKGLRVSVLGIGSKTGSDVRTRDGELERVALDSRSLQALAAAGDGNYAPIAVDDSDLRALNVLQPRAEDAIATQGRAGKAWEDAGYWLLLPLMAIALFAFRRGAGVAAVLVVLCLPPGFVHAQARDAVQGSLWRRADQVAAERMDAGEQSYRKGDFTAAEHVYDGLPGADAHYNLGNALAKQGRYDEAIDAYNAALREHPGMADAIANRNAVLKAKQRKPPSGKSKHEDPRSQGQQGDQKQKGSGKTDSEAPEPGKAQGQGTPQSQPQQKPASSESQSQGQSKPAPPPKNADPEAQRAADAAQRERMQRALQGKQPGQQDPSKTPQAARPETAAERERRLANEAWLRRVPDDPGGLLRAKFQIEYERRQQGGE